MLTPLENLPWPIWYNPALRARLAGLSWHACIRYESWAQYFISPPVAGSNVRIRRSIYVSRPDLIPVKIS